MRTKKKFILILCAFSVSCGSNKSTPESEPQDSSLYPSFYSTFPSLDLNNLSNYANQEVPEYIIKDNSGATQITNRGAFLGRILFYDKALSSSNAVSCSSCHSQDSAFSDRLDASLGVNGSTGRHSMRLINTKFADESKFFWDERALSLESQTTQPIQDHNEMGFSGTNGDEDLEALLSKLMLIGYYQDLFFFVYGDSEVTEQRLQLSLAQFIRSIQSFDSKYDVGRAAAPNDATDFANFTPDENIGKTLFLNPPNRGGAGCAVCHRPPEFDIDPNSRNNGVVGDFAGGVDLNVTRSPSLRDLVNPQGASNGHFMHDASLATLEDVVEHYASGITSNSDLDNRLNPGGNPQRLNLTATEKNQLVDFLKTLSGYDVYTNEKWSDPF